MSIARQNVWGLKCTIFVWSHLWYQEFKLLHQMGACVGRRHVGPFARFALPVASCFCAELFDIRHSCSAAFSRTINPLRRKSFRSWATARILTNSLAAGRSKLLVDDNHIIIYTQCIYIFIYIWRISSLGISIRYSYRLQLAMPSGTLTSLDVSIYSIRIQTDPNREYVNARFQWIDC